MESHIKFVAIAVVAFLLLISCSTTQTTNTWVDQSYRGSPVSDVLVIAVSKDRNLRRIHWVNQVPQCCQNHSKIRLGLTKKARNLI